MIQWIDADGGIHTVETCGCGVCTNWYAYKDWFAKEGWILKK